MSKKDILILAGPSAVGKSTVATFLSGEGFSLVRSATTRERRDDSFDAEYLYLTEEAFAQQAEAGAFVEHTRYAEFSYGTPRAELSRIFAEGKCPLLILDAAGVRAFRESEYADRVYAAYLYDTLNTLDERLYQRELADAPSADALLRFVSRKERNTAEYRDIAETASLFDLLLKNETAQDTAQSLLDSMRAGKCLSEEERAKVVSLLAEMAAEKDAYMTEH